MRCFEFETVSLFWSIVHFETEPAVLRKRIQNNWRTGTSFALASGDPNGYPDMPSPLLGSATDSAVVTRCMLRHIASETLSAFTLFTQLKKRYCAYQFQALLGIGTLPARTRRHPEYPGRTLVRTIRECLLAAANAHSHAPVTIWPP